MQRLINRAIADELMGPAFEDLHDRISKVTDNAIEAIKQQAQASIQDLVEAEQAQTSMPRFPAYSSAYSGC